ncbi:hypothetical protein [Rhodohalobacter sp. 614A]|uniref:hypothetical protein n=1 Tax=Rhodohalobacter sp. 614A TaxID=2908649 RepID=UPI001F1C2E35|nr:hypothetical protein [Rhodohalobacter sp. 614A]
MKKAAILLVTVFVSCIWMAGEIFAQQRIVEKTFSANSEEKIRLNLKFGDSIVVKGWDRNEVSFRAVVEVNSGKLNDAFVANYSDGNSGIRIDTDFDKDKLEDGRAEDCPDRSYGSYSWNDGKKHKVVCSNITFELYVPRNSDLQLETISADVELYDLNGPIDAKSISGFVDLSWPDRNGADISLKTITGEAYSDLENLSFKNRQEFFPHVGYELRGEIGSGGPMLRLESISGDVYLRKRKG